MKKLKDLQIKEKYQAYRQWQEQPYQVSPMSEECHVCQTCGTEFRGNYCPRCGQSAKIGRYSFKTAFLGFLDVWGMGNRGMFRTLRDLIFRPGYMIRDYLKGMQMAYFPPFKMFFLLAALSLLVANGLNIKGQRASTEETKTEVPTPSSEIQSEDPTQQGVGNQLGNEAVKVIEKFMDAASRFSAWSPALFTLTWLLLISGFLYPFFHYSPNIPDLRYAEFFVAIIYTTNMFTIFSIVFDFFCLNGMSMLAMVLTLIPLKQLSGYSWKRMFFYVFLASVSVLALILNLLIAFIVILGWIYHEFLLTESIVALVVIALLSVAILLFVRWITRHNERRQQMERVQEHLRNVRKTISGLAPNRNGKVPPTPSEM